jgi:hypothetical protein
MANIDLTDIDYPVTKGCNCKNCVATRKARNLQDPEDPSARRDYLHISRDPSWKNPEPFNQFKNSGFTSEYYEYDKMGNVLGGHYSEDYKVDDDDDAAEGQ